MKAGIMYALEIGKSKLMVTEAEYSTNPAWILFDLSHQPIYRGSGTLADPFMVEKYEGVNPSELCLLRIKKLADYCNQEVPLTDTDKAESGKCLICVRADAKSIIDRAGESNKSN